VNKKRGEEKGGEKGEESGEGGGGGDRQERVEKGEERALDGLQLYN
jgi:hypothetical protein